MVDISISIIGQHVAPHRCIVFRNVRILCAVIVIRTVDLTMYLPDSATINTFNLVTIQIRCLPVPHTTVDVIRGVMMRIHYLCTRHHDSSNFPSLEKMLSSLSSNKQINKPMHARSQTQTHGAQTFARTHVRMHNKL